MTGPTRQKRQALLKKGDAIHDRYEIETQLGQGGMAQVYRGLDRLIDRVVAIKVLDLPMAELHGDHRQEALERFEREVKASALIAHPNAVTIYDTGVLEDSGQPYMVMELLSGRDLEAELKIGGPMATARAVSLCLDALEALEKAHDQGVVHKDLKPSNLFLRSDTKRESLCVVDFGIAHVLHDPKGRLTHTGFMCGTPQYLAPEYIDGGHILPAGDVYQMGLILVEMITGIPVVNDPTPHKCIMRHGSGELALSPKITASPLGPVLALALALAPEDRFEHAGAFYEALKAVDLETLPYLEAPPAPDPERDKATVEASYTPDKTRLDEPEPETPDLDEADEPEPDEPALDEAAQDIDPPETAPDAAFRDTEDQAPRPAPVLDMKAKVRLFQILAIAACLALLVLGGVVVGLLIPYLFSDDASANPASTRANQTTFEVDPLSKTDPEPESSDGDSTDPDLILIEPGAPSPRSNSRAPTVIRERPKAKAKAKAKEKGKGKGKSKDKKKKKKKR